MTRINIVPAELLTNEHLLAEYKELPRVFTNVKKLLEKGKNLKDVDIPERYVLGTGHVKFFYNKLRWLIERYQYIYNELKVRGYSLDLLMFEDILWDAVELSNDPRISPYLVTYNPTPEDFYLNMVRLSKRSKIKMVLKELTDESDIKYKSDVEKILGVEV